MSTVTAKQLHQETSKILDLLEKGEPLMITRNGRTIGKLSPLDTAKAPPWDDVMGEVWQAQSKVKAAARAANPVLAERQRRRR